MPTASPVSVIMPVYNGACYLRAALDSCLAQTAPPREIVVVDDASTDDSAEIAREYAARDPRVVLLLHPENLGLCRTALDAATAATSPYLCYLDQDDILPPEHVATMVQALDDRAALVFCNSILIDAGGNPGPLLQDDAWLARNAAHARFWIATRNFINTCGLLVRRDLVARVGGWDGRFRNYGHWLLFIKLLALGEARFTTATRSRYRRHASSMTSTFAARPVRAELQRYIDYCREYALAQGGFGRSQALALHALMYAKRLYYRLRLRAYTRAGPAREPR